MQVEEEVVLQKLDLSMPTLRVEKVVKVIPLILQEQVQSSVQVVAVVLDMG
jgi:hypothetical protein